MFRVNQYRPNLRKSYGKVKTHQWSAKPCERNVETILNIASSEGRILKEEITGLSVLMHDDKIGAIFIDCSDPRYPHIRGYHSFMVYYRLRGRKEFYTPKEEKDEEAQQSFLMFLRVAKEYFKENDLNVKVELEFEETTIDEILSSF